MIYLASPYHHSEQTVRRARYEEVCRIAGKLMAAGIHLYCPIAHSHPMAECGDLPNGWDYWREYDRWYIERCDVLVVAQMDGWRDSVGVTAEIEMANELKKPVIFLEPGKEDAAVPFIKASVELAKSEAHANWEEKIWGRVQHIFDGRVAVSLLETVAGRCCSTHYHRLRHNMFYVVEGQIDIVTYCWYRYVDVPADKGEISRVRLARGMQFSVSPSAVHRFEVVESGRVVEIYWADPPGAPVDINDIVRLDEGHVL